MSGCRPFLFLICVEMRQVPSTQDIALAESFDCRVDILEMLFQGWAVVSPELQNSYFAAG